MTWNLLDEESRMMCEFWRLNRKDIRSRTDCQISFEWFAWNIFILTQVSWPGLKFIRYRRRYWLPNRISIVGHSVGWWWEIRYQLASSNFNFCRGKPRGNMFLKFRRWPDFWDKTSYCMSWLVLLILETRLNAVWTLFQVKFSNKQQTIYFLCDFS